MLLLPDKQGIFYVPLLKTKVEQDFTTDTQIVKFVNIRHILLETVYFVDYQYHRLVGTAQHVRHLRISGMRAIAESDLIDGKYLLVQKGKKNYYLVIAE